MSEASMADPEWGLEHLLLFGPPENKLELLDGCTPCAFPFERRDVAERHFIRWAEQLRRLLPAGDASAVAQRGGSVAEWRSGDVELTLHKRPVHLRLPVPTDVYHWAHGCFFRPELWGEPGVARRRRRTGWLHFQDHWDIKLNVWKVFADARERLPGWGIGGVDVSLSVDDVIAPDHCFYRGRRGSEDFAARTILGQYFKGAPDLVVEVFSDYSRPLDRGPRMELCRRNRVAHLWHIDPDDETLAAYELRGTEYDRVARLTVSDHYEPPAFPELTIEVASLFDTQSKRRRGDNDAGDGEGPAEALGEWGVPEHQRVGLEHIMVLGHAERRREIWNGRVPCRLAFASEREAQFRVRGLLEDAARWEAAPVPTPRPLEVGDEHAEVGRFRVIRRGRVINVDVQVDGRLYRELLRVCATREAWDWGDDA
jgi:Uma2 family endonuclease